MPASGGDHRRQPPSHHTPQVSRGFQVAAALAVLALVAIVVATSRMETPPWAAPYVHSTVDMAVVAEDIVFEDVDSIDVVLPGEHQPLLWRLLDDPSSSAAHCVLLAEPKDKPAQQTCLFANVCVNKTERSPCTECRTDPPNLRRQRQHQFACQIAVVPAELCRLCERNRSACTSWSVGVDGPLR